MVKAICFDFDGTLVDSEHLHYASWQAELQPFGCSLEKKPVYGTVLRGVYLRDCRNTHP